MQIKSKPLGVITIGFIVIVFAVGIWLATATPANAQCGSQASSCKNCHEVQGELSVNSDDSAWHPSHAFGDFCYICHGGNNQATDADAAHEGMVAPLLDIQASCQQCHVADLEDRAQVYADILGVEIGSGDSSSTGSDTTASDSAATTTVTTASVGLPAAGDLVIDDADMVDYVQRYDELVLGNTPVNWGNVILIGMIGLLAVGGGGFVLYNEGWVSITTKPIKPVPNGYQEDLVDLLPNIQQLSTKGRKGLKSILKDPKSADELLDVLGRHTKGDE